MREELKRRHSNFGFLKWARDSQLPLQRDSRYPAAVREEPFVGDKVLGLLEPEELSLRGSRAVPGWLEQIMHEGATAAIARLKGSTLRENPSMPTLIGALFRQSIWSGRLLSPRTATAMWGKQALLRAMPQYRLGDLVVMRDGAPLDLTALGKPGSRLGKNVEVLFRELTKPNTGFRLRRVQRYHPRVKTFADQLAKVLATEVNVNGYASLSRGNIFPEHWDAHDVALLQTYGTKTWRVRSNELPMPVAGHRKVLRQPSPTARQITLRLTPGRSLLLPRGHWHVGEGDDSIHLTFGLPEDTIAARIADVSVKTLARHLPELEYRASMFMFDPRSPKADAALNACLDAYLRALRATLLDAKQLRKRPGFYGRPFF